MLKRKVFDPELQRLNKYLNQLVKGMETSGWCCIDKRGRQMKLKGGQAVALKVICPSEHYNAAGKLADPENWDVSMSLLESNGAHTHTLMLTSLLDEATLTEIFAKYDLTNAERKFAHFQKKKKE